MNTNCLTVYYDPEWDQRDGKGFCVDLDYKDENGQKRSGTEGFRFRTSFEAGNFVTSKLFQMKTGEENS